MKLIEQYALQTGLKIGRQSLLEAFYPLPFERYITLHAGSGMQAKNYPHYNEVVALLAPKLVELGIQIVQLGGKDEPAIRGAHHLQGQISLHQSNYVLARSLLHIGNDSWLAHRAGDLNIPLVALYGSTTVANHSPYRVHPKSRLLESHRWGRQATFSPQENPQSIALICPERVANAALSALNQEPAITRRSLWFGPNYYDALVETVPDVAIAPNAQIGGPLVVRMDYLHNEEVLFQNLQVRPCAIITSHEIDLAKLAAFKPHVSSMRVFIDLVSPDWIKRIKRLGVPIGFVSAITDEAKVQQMRLDYADVCMFDPWVTSTKEGFLSNVKAYLHDDTFAPDVAALSFLTHKVLLSDGKAYLSKAHWQAKQATDANTHNIGRVIDSPDWFAEVNHTYVFFQ